MKPLDIHPTALYEQVQSDIGSFQVLRNYRLNSVRTGVWKLQSDQDSKCYYLKTYSRKQRWHPEVYAYRHWIGQLKPYVPELIAAYEGEGWQAILITSMDGLIMRDTELSPLAVEAAYRKAGELTKVLHDSQIGDWFGRPDINGNPIELSHNEDPVNYVSSSIREVTARCMEENLLQSSEISLTDWALQNVHVFRHSRPVPISWDSTPGNWLVDEQGFLTGMIDFENMLWGLAVDNFSILFARYFIDHPSARDAYFAGYGLEVLKDQSAEIQICCIKMALGDICWGTHNHQPEVVRSGRELMKRIHNQQLFL
ncbi:aminoglycoside phosphotransferase [Paenibacillus sp. FSL R7-277]|uniref:aminoglycoside phosphotransferase family protein n=1 Tax=Paenibacillus sp. FSL R7-277 TaxID=1227352 RepID=UPI0003E1DC5F|nr:aminoglycoside phosphotransferase family protein [Paenibacillus sp. FSL R7-277]ETT63198.1 aminoglycoside phosphotransferase [Paenibacillus sp. FSL R7-277]